MSLEIKLLQQRLAAFALDRDWDQFHSPKNLATSLSIEAAELLEIFQWMTTDESNLENLSAEDVERAKEELADVFGYLLRIADKLGIDLEEAVREKLLVNAQKYPVDLSKGNATKYNRRTDKGE